MFIREPLVHATYFYLRESSGDSLTRREERHEAFVTDAHRLLQTVSGWLALSAPSLPPIPFWEAEAPLVPQPIMQTGELQGRTNASAWLTAYVLRNMLLLRVVIARPGEHEQSVWPMLDEALGSAPTTPSWLHTTRYWCGMAPRPPEDLSQDRSQPIHAPFGVLCLGWNTAAHLLVYPDAKTEARATAFLRTLAAQLDWYPVQARYRLGEYESRAASSTRQQQLALDRVAQSVQGWAVPTNRSRLESISPLQNELTLLEHTYQNVLADLAATEAAAYEVRSLMSEYRQMLLQNGLWDAAPTVWEAQVAGLTAIQERIEADVKHIDMMLRRTDLLIRGLQARIALLNSERERLLIYVLAGIGLALLTVLVVDTDLAQVGIRVAALVLVAVLGWAAWQWSQGRWRR